MKLPSVFRREKLPTDFLERHQVPEFTPDLIALERHRANRVFICCELMKRHFMENCLTNALYADRLPVLSADRYSLIKADSPSGERVIPLKERYANVPYLRIKGELYGLTAEMMVELDNYKRNGVTFQRHRIDLIVPGYVNGFITAWFYIGEPRFWDDRVCQVYEDEEELARLKASFRIVDGKLFKVIKNTRFRAVNVFQPNDGSEEYYYNTIYIRANRYSPKRRYIWRSNSRISNYRLWDYTRFGGEVSSMFSIWDRKRDLLNSLRDRLKASAL